jgi:hypothetical protein
MEKMRSLFVLVLGVLLAAVGAVWLTGCVTGRPPAFVSPQAVGDAVLLLQPEVRLGQAAASSTEAQITDGLNGDLRDGLAGNNISIVTAEPGADTKRLRAALLSGLLAARAAGFGRVKPGADLGVSDLVAPVAREGAHAIVFGVLSRAPQGEFVPRAPDEIVPLPDDRPDYVIPQTGRAANSVDSVALDVVVVDSRTGRAIAHRHVVHPARNIDDVRLAIPVLVHEALRGLQP